MLILLLFLYIGWPAAFCWRLLIQQGRRRLAPHLSLRLSLQALHQARGTAQEGAAHG